MDNAARMPVAQYSSKAEMTASLHLDQEVCGDSQMPPVVHSCCQDGAEQKDVTRGTGAGQAVCHASRRHHLVQAEHDGRSMRGVVVRARPVPVWQEPTSRHWMSLAGRAAGLDGCAGCGSWPAGALCPSAMQLSAWHKCMATAATIASERMGLPQVACAAGLPAHKASCSTWLDCHAVPCRNACANTCRTATLRGLKAASCVLLGSAVCLLRLHLTHLAPTA